MISVHSINKMYVVYSVCYCFRADGKKRMWDFMNNHKNLTVNVSLSYSIMFNVNRKTDEPPRVSMGATINNFKFLNKCENKAFLMTYPQINSLDYKHMWRPFSYLHTPSYEFPLMLICLIIIKNLNMPNATTTDVNKWRQIKYSP